MRPYRRLVLTPFLAIFLGLLPAPVMAATYFVNLNSTNPVAPYANWSTASTDIQSAINLATNGDLVLVTNGAYHNDFPRMFLDPVNQNVQIRACVGISGGLTVSSVNGPGFTSIQGFPGFPGSCVYLATNAFLSGFTLKNGTAYTSGPPTAGGGAYCESTNAVISNCLICSNNSPDEGGGVFRGTLNDCILSNNSAQYYGGGSAGSVLNNCTLIGNTVTIYSGSAAFGGALNDCLLVSNTVAPGQYGIYGGAACSNVLNNCLIVGNTASFNEASVAVGSFLTNCTIAENRYNPQSDGVPVVHSCVLRNCILYYNGYENLGTGNYGGSDLKNCCAEPNYNFPSGSNNNITNAPLFVNTNNDFHLQPNSPCINSGNNAYVVSATDFDGNPRTVGGTVDIGAYEYQTPTSVISYAYLQQYGLPTDGSVDYADLDGTAFNVYQDWVAGLNPTNPVSVLAMLRPLAATNSTGITVSWQSVTGVQYDLQRSANLSAQPAFSTIQRKITGQAGTTSYQDTSATNTVPYFYRVRVSVP